MNKLIAEIGWNHMGDMKLAKKMIEEAKKSGADICKFQTWSEKNLKPGPWDEDGRREIYIKAELSKDDHIFLKKICEDVSVEFLTSIFNIEDIDFLKDIGLNKIKIPSHEVNNHDLISECLKNFDKVFISTGASTWEEIVHIKDSYDLNKILFMHCVSSYPCDSDKINFPRMKKLKEFNGKVGYSGHFMGVEDALIAISKGADYVEKHFTIDRDLPGRDNKFAILPSEMEQISTFIRNFTEMNIDRGLDLQDCEKDTFENYRGRWSKNA